MDKKVTKGLFIIGIVIYLIATSLYVAHDFSTRIAEQKKDIDNRLKYAVAAGLQIIGDDFHDRVKDESSISREEYINLVEKLSNYCKDAGVKYLYTMYMKDGKVYITSTSISDEERKAGEYGNFFDAYEDSTVNLVESFSNMNPFFEEASDKWGNFRSYILPKVTSDGRVYIIGADVEIEHIDKMFRFSLFISIVTALFFLAIIIPIVYIYIIINKRHVNEMLHNLYRDRLTGLWNRNKLIEDIVEIESPVLILMNINSFKEINDFFGHEIGDVLLKGIGERLIKTHLKYRFNVYRMFADEYAVLFDAEPSEDELRYLGKYFIETISDEPFRHKENDITVSITTGIASKNHILDFDKENVEIILICADMALKKAKKEGKQAIVYEESMQIKKEYERNIKWSKRILEAIKEGRVIPYFQPIVNNKNGKIEKYETLIRMIGEDGKIIPPLEFLDVAKKSRLYHYLTKIVITKAFEIFRGKNVEFSINLSVDDILDDITAQFVLSKLKGYENSEKVVFEILESEGIDNYDKVTDFIAKVKEFGSKIAIDDFGSGYSNYMHILKLNVDYIKIDGTMIKNINEDKNSHIIVESIAKFSKKIGVKTIAEFVATEEIYNTVKNLEIDYSQGYFLGKPQGSLMEEHNMEEE